MPDSPRRTLNRIETTYYNLTRHMPWRFRLDALLVFGSILFLAITAAAWAIYTLAGSRFGWFDPALLSRVADDRILTNIREDLEVHPLLATVWHPASGQIVIAQAGNEIHRYQPDTGLWSTEQPLAGLNLFSSDIDQLRSGCGGDPQSFQKCPAPNALWALTQQGALLRNTVGQWTALTTETQFKGISGLPVDQTALTVAAISDDRRLLIVGTRADGAGVYDLTQRRWLYSVQPVFERQPLNEITQVVAWSGEFWFGEPGGLAHMPQTGSATTPVEAVTGSVLDLDVIDNTLWVLERGPCETGDASCIRLYRWRPLLGPEVVLEEQNNYPQVSLSTLNHIQAWGKQVLLAGTSGVYLYDPDRHSWTQAAQQNVLSILPLPDLFLFGYAGGVGFLSEQDQAPTFVQIPGERIIQLTPSTVTGEVIALAGSGNAFRIQIASRRITTMFVPDHSRLKPKSFLSAVAVGQQIFFAGPDGGLLHNVATRQYQKVDVANLPDWLTAQSPNWWVTGDNAYAALSSDPGRLSIYTVPASDLLNPATSAQQWAAIQPVSLPGPSQATWTTSRGLDLVAGDGSAYEVTPSGLTRLIGPANPELNDAVFRDVTTVGTDFFMATNRGLLSYSLISRIWGSYFDLKPDDPVAELDSLSGQLLARSQQGTLMQFSNGNRKLLIGGAGFSLNDDQISDARLVADQLYVAGQGRIEQYDFNRRQVAQRWDLGASGPVQIVSIANGIPWTITGGELYAAEQSLDVNAPPILSASVRDNQIWTVRQGEAGRYIQVYDSTQTTLSTVCYFLNPSIGGLHTQFWDARTAPGTANVLAATSDGLYLYAAAQRSWYLVDPTPLPAGTRLYAFNPFLLLTIPTSSGMQLKFIDSGSLAPGNTCVNRTGSRVAYTIDAVQSTVDEPGQHVAWLEDDGSVNELLNGQINQILARSSEAPDSAQIRSVYQSPHSAQALLAVTDQALWRYDLQQRDWRQISISGIPSTDTLIGLEISQTTTQAYLIGRMQSGAYYRGLLDQNESQVAFQKIYTPPARTFGHPASALVDVFRTDNQHWGFLLSDRILYYNAHFRTWEDEVALPAGSQATQILNALGRLVVVDAAHGQWLVADTPGSVPTAFHRWAVPAGQIHALTSGGSIWIFDPKTGLIQQCQAGADLDFSCLPFGVDAYTDLRVENDGKLVAVRPDGSLNQLASLAVLQPAVAPNLDTGWLRWDSGQHLFDIINTNGQIQQSYTPEQFINNGELLFESLEALQIDNAGQAQGANPAGLWHFASDTPDLAGQVAFIPFPFVSPIRSANGYFVAGGHTYTYTNGQISAGPDVITIGAGDAVFRNDLLNQSVTARLTVGTQIVQAWEPQGLVWDRDRRGLAYVDDQLQLQSAAGLGPIAQLTQFDPGPQGLALQPPAVQSETVTTAGIAKHFYTFNGLDWYERSAKSWVPVSANPRQTRQVVNGPTWIWTVQADELQVSAASAGPSFAVRHDDRGIGFSADVLQAAAAYQGELFFMSDAFLQIVDSVDKLPSFGGKLLPSESTQILDAIQFGNATSGLYRTDGAAVSRWDPSTQAFITVVDSDNPYQHRLLVDGPRLRFVSLGSTIQKEVLVDELGSQTPAWVPFNLLPGGVFPFDSVTAFATYNSRLFVGSAAGLQVYPSTNVSLNSLAQLMDMRDQASGSLSPVSQVGRPAATPDIVMATAANHCIQQSAGAAFTICNDPTGLQERLRTQNSLWTWTSTQPGLATGIYRSTPPQRGVGTLVTITNGRFGHDQLRAATVCQGQLYSAWAGQIVSAFRSDSPSLTDLTTNFRLPDMRVEALVCLENALVLPGQSVPAGLYALGEQTSYLDGAAWKTITDPDIQAALQSRSKQPTLFESGRLRLPAFVAGVGPVFEHQDNSGVWTAVPWVNDLVGFDSWHRIIAANGQLWAATAVGLVSFGQDNPGAVNVDPAQMVWVQEPKINDTNCFVTDSVLVESEVWLRCDYRSDRVFRGTLALGKDSSVFAQATSDPFAEVDLISGDQSSPWQWRVRDRILGRPGVLEGFLCLPHGDLTKDRQCDVSIDLTKGHFDFDRLTNLAWLEGQSQIDLSAGGSRWFETTPASFALSSWVTPSATLPDDEVVSQVDIAQIGDKPVLCLIAESATYVLQSHTDAPERQACLGFMADDGFWRYERSLSGLSIQAYGEKSQGGTGQRLLSNGRFMDDLVTGLPATATQNGEVYYVVPTQAGIEWWDDKLRPYRIDVAPFSGLSKTESPTTLLVTPESGLPAYVTPQGVYQLNDSRSGLDNYRPRVSGVPIYLAELGTQSLVRYARQTSTGLQWNFQDPVGQATCVSEQVNTLCLDLIQLGLQSQVAAGEPAVSPYLLLRIAPDRFEAWQLGDPAPLVVEYPAVLKLVDVVLHKDKVFLIGASDAYIIDLSVLLKRMGLKP